MKNKKQAFSLVEILISITIVVLISVVWASAFSTYDDSSKNSKVVSDLLWLKSSLDLYIDQEGDLNIPSWNLKFYKDDASYAHDFDDDAFWVSGYITENTFPKKYINYIPLDPKTNQYYAYARTKSSLSYELAWVISKNWWYYSIVRWNYDWDSSLYSLVKEYNGPEFVYDNWSENFPYNPEYRSLVWKINSFSWEIFINDYELLVDDIDYVLLEEGDNLFVWTWSNIDIYLSDWNQILLGDINSSTELDFSTMEYTNDDNIVSSIKLILNLWTIWTKASKLNKSSEFEVYTQDMVAAVRWTIFWISKDADFTNITILKWKIKIDKIEKLGKEELAEKVIDNSVNKTKIISSHPNVIQEDDWSYLEVIDWENEKWIDLELDDSLNETISSSTWSLQNIDSDLKNEINDETFELINNFKSNISEISYDWMDKNIHIENPWFKKEDIESYYIVLNDSKFELKEENLDENNDIFIAWSSNFLNDDWYISLNEIINEKSLDVKVCNNDTCTKEVSKVFSEELLNTWSFEIENEALSNPLEEKVSCNKLNNFDLFNWECVFSPVNLKLVWKASYNNIWDYNLVLDDWIIKSDNNLENNLCYPNFNSKDFTINLSWENYRYWFNIFEDKECNWSGVGSRAFLWSVSGADFSLVNNNYPLYSFDNKKWIFLSNKNETNNYIKYDLKPLKIRRDFAFWIKLRWSSLFRYFLNNWEYNYSLFDFKTKSKWKIKLILSKIWSGNTWELELIHTSRYWTENKIVWLKIRDFLEKIESKNLDDTYQIIVWFHGKKWIISIIDKNWNKIIEKYNIWKRVRIKDSINLFSYEDDWKYTNQWNDLIYNFSVYKWKNKFRWIASWLKWNYKICDEISDFDFKSC